MTRVAVLLVYGRILPGVLQRGSGKATEVPILGRLGIFNRLALCLFQNLKTPGIMDARGVVLNRQEQIKRMVRHLFKAILFVKVDG